MLPKHSVNAEVGVFRGGFTAHILRTVKSIELCLMDAWWLWYGDYYSDWGACIEFGKLLRTEGAFDHGKRVVARLDRQSAAVFHV
jgi:hypothetical protein